MLSKQAFLPSSPDLAFFPRLATHFFLSFSFHLFSLFSPNSTLWASHLSLDSLFLLLAPGAKCCFSPLEDLAAPAWPLPVGEDPLSGDRVWDLKETGSERPEARTSSPEPVLRRPTRHLSPALPAHTLRTPAAPGALPPPTLRLPPLPAGADAQASPPGAAPASQDVGARRGSDATQARGASWAVASCCPWLSHLRPSPSRPRPAKGGLSLIVSTPILCSFL